LIRTYSVPKGEVRSVGQLDKAVADFSTAIELDKKDANTWFNRGIAYRRLGQWDKAVADDSRVIKLNPKDAWAHNTLAWLLATCPDAKLRDPQQAVKLASKAARSGMFADTPFRRWCRSVNPPCPPSSRPSRTRSQ
jgi:tetratricopeptide (TPR) repeat protein